MRTLAICAGIMLALGAGPLAAAPSPAERAERQARRAQAREVALLLRELNPRAPRLAAAQPAPAPPARPATNKTAAPPAAAAPKAAVRPATNAAPPLPLSAANPYEAPHLKLPLTPLDEIVQRQWQKLGITPAPPCSDAVFVRRVYLDVIGTLPTALEAREFLLDRNPNKRKLLIDRLLEREEYADYWTLKWADLLRVKAEFPINLWPNAVQAYHRYLYTSLRDNKPYDQFARELLTASGSNFRVGQVNFYRAVQDKTPEGIARAVALTFMGERAEQWPPEKLAGLAGFFAHLGFKSTTEWKEEIVYFDPLLQPTQKIAGLELKPVFPDGTPPRILPAEDPREVFARWLTSPQNPWFARNLANRAWFWFMGRGIIHEPDDARPDNPPSNPELLAYLEKELVAAKYDMKRLFRLILNSRTYQSSALLPQPHPKAAEQFAYYPMRRLEAEVLIDALNQVTGTTEKYSSPIPEPFTFIPENQRSIALADGSITSPFLELFGRPPRDTGLELERNNRLTAAQRLHLLNSSHIQRKLERSQMIAYQMQGNRPLREIISNIYLGILSRWPTEKELRTFEQYVQESGLKPRDAALDLSWSLINSSEFLFRH
ncbi:MAG: DUF1549 and DUF1553 domain-containing protein [Verrucomicrobiae bacterium]|nr:DUF1549 and DUF1553 domain-containing protein [Verrucomicrobiae bacterium]